MRLTLLKKGLLLIAVPLVFQLLFIFVLNRTLAEAEQAERLLIHTKDVLVTAETALADMVRAQSAGRGYVITGNPEFDREIVAELARSQGKLAELRQKVADNPGQQARAEVLIVDGQQLSEWISQTATIVRAGEQARAAERIARLEGKSRMDKLRADVVDFIRHESELEAQRLGQLRAARSAQRWIVGGGIFGSALVTAFIAWIFARGISSRIQIVTRNAEALADNRMLASRVRGHDEVARLDEVMHETSRRLTDSQIARQVLTAEVEKRAAALAASNESLRQQTQENEMFVYSVSHDLRSPLVNLQGFSQELDHAGKDLRKLMIDERIPADIRARVEHMLRSDVDDSIRFIQTAVTRSASIIDALLRLSRAGRVEYRPQFVDVHATVQRVIEAMNNTIESKNVRVEVGSLPPCWGDPTAIEQIFGNLIGNAVNYLDPVRSGFVEVGWSTDSRALREGCHTYYVRDNGLGIPAAYLAKVFVAFQRLHGEVARGEGIGLALVRRAVERHGGVIWVESTENVGTTFYLALPTNETARKASVVARVTATSEPVPASARATPESA